MGMTDPIADMLTRIRNAASAGHKKVDVPASGLKREIARILSEEHFINGFTEAGEEKKKVIRIYLKYDPQNESVIKGIKRISKPGLRHYVKKADIPRVLGGMGIAIISTSSGVLSDKKARKIGVGGEVLCHIW